MSGVDALLLDHQPLRDSAPVPYFLALNARLKTSVKKGEVISLGAIETPAESTLLLLRLEQDRTSFG